MNNCLCEDPRTVHGESGCRWCTCPDFVADDLPQPDYDTASVGELFTLEDLLRKG